jgi:adenine-specific DNA-methyltransferase
VVLSFPFKDCVLEGGQSKDDEKRKEIFFNEVLAKDEIFHQKNGLCYLGR